MIKFPSHSRIFQLTYSFLIMSMMLVHLASELWKNSFAPRFTMRGHLQFFCRFLFTLFLLNKSEWIPGRNWLQSTSSLMLMGSLFAPVWSVLFGESVRHLPKRFPSKFLLIIESWGGLPTCLCSGALKLFWKYQNGHILWTNACRNMRTCLSRVTFLFCDKSLSIPVENIPSS